MITVSQLEDSLEEQTAVILAAEKWAPSYKKNKDALALLIKFEAKLERVLRKHFRELANERMSSYINWELYSAQQIKAYSFEVIVDVQEFEDDEVEIMMATLNDPLAYSISLGAQTAEKQYKIELGLNQYSNAITKAAESYTAKLVKGLSDSTKTRISQSIATSIRLGEDLEAAKKRLSKVVNDPKRATTIARTESVRSFSRGITVFGEESKATAKFWEISSDPCAICAENEGAKVGLDEEFPSGDMEPPAHPNCRCGVSLEHDYS